MRSENVFWVVWEPESGQPRVVHDREASAISEAHRLAKANTGKTFFVLKAISSYEHNAVRETILLEPDLPF
jgi:hypothetical protein